MLMFVSRLIAFPLLEYLAWKYLRNETFLIFTAGLMTNQLDIDGYEREIFRKCDADRYGVPECSSVHMSAEQK